MIPNFFLRSPNVWNAFTKISTSTTPLINSETSLFSRNSLFQSNNTLPPPSFFLPKRAYATDKSGKYRDVVNALNTDARVKLTWDEFVNVCEQNGVSGNEVDTLSQNLHQTGQIMHFNANENFSNVVIIKPEELTKKVLKVLDAGGHYTEALTQKLEAKLELLEKEYEPLKTTHDKMLAKANSRATAFINVSLAWLVLQGLAVARLTWWELSWDIMEPVTYMITFMTITGGLAFFAATGTEYTYEALHETLVKRRMAKFTKRWGFNEERYKEVSKEIEEIREILKNPERELMATSPNSL